MGSKSHSEHHGLHVSSVKFNAQILGALLFLTALTYVTALMDLGFLDTPVALLIAFGKTTLVVLFFMHVRWSSQYVKILAASGFAFLILLFGITFSDVLTRTQEYPWSDYTWPGAKHRALPKPDGHEAKGRRGIVPEMAHPEAGHGHEPGH